MNEETSEKQADQGQRKRARKARPRLEGFKREILNLPNLITIGRIFMIPPVLFLVDKADPFKGVLAMALFLSAGGLDLLDGWLARRRNLVTFFGKFADPLADKIMVMALLVYLTAEGRVPPWLIVILLGREFYISGLRMLALNEGVEISADAGGKAKTSFQVIGISMVLIYFPYHAPWGGWIRFYELGMLLLYTSAVLSVWSAFSYTRGFIQALSKVPDED
ncbi:MAG: CDP-diacylglycerol--glycerol-3-phosphate 3-phosphatidyltransferase [Myxococcales bacterium]|nr:CDP-diacylglycerol--glycerol-3-phosphate 3-phosphatidyltransferase [Myxococcales bacterium]MCA9701178.1 CDP-diacylglycerol--glycerol-3-phosphate 3-phosphatidyltransferase [Myxococcales bacterium]